VYEFVIVQSGGDPIIALRAAFPEIWNELLECADPDAPHLMYFAFADLLLLRRDDADLWRRAYRFFDEVAERGDAAAHDVLEEAFDRLWDSDVGEEVQEHLGPAARAIFQRSRL
jgi:hypothetical protein